MEGRRPTQSDVAKMAGVHRASVSLAFKNHPSIPEGTKKRIRHCAEKLGYAPDPMLSSLAAYRSRNRPKAFQGTLAWLTNGYADWRENALFRDFYAGASQRAKTHGFNLEVFDLQQLGMSCERTAAILHARNIGGVLLPPQPRSNVEIIGFPWEDFSAVTFGYSLVKPELHCVTSTQFRAMVRTMREVKALGYERIGFFFTPEHDEKTDHNYLAGYLAETFQMHKGESIPPLFSSERPPQLFMEWFERHRPQVIVTGNRDILMMLKSLGIDAPSDVGVASPLVLEKDSPLAGVYENSFHIGEVALDFLVAMIHRGERGIPACPQRVLVEGTWNPGRTLRAGVKAG
jgi:LacI family transcriptional regulator/LacI family repressor for deo operon, udp, cdd, tsx, nupC, and nupG